MLIIFNPAAGRRRTQRLWRVLDIMATSGVRLEIVETQHAGHATELASTAARDGRQLVVAAGGDGTIAEIAAGLAGSDCKLGIIPIGTANVLAHELGLSFSPAGVAAALAFVRTVNVWPGAAVGADGTRLFVQMLGAGFDAQVVRNLSLGLKRAIGRSSYVLQSMRELGRYAFPPIAVSLDGKCSEAGSVIVSKGRLYAGRNLVAPGCRPTDRGFSVVLFERPGALQAAMCGAALPFDLIPHMPGVRVLRAEHVELDCRNIPAQTDGDPCGNGRLVIDNAPGSIGVVVG